MLNYRTAHKSIALYDYGLPLSQSNRRIISVIQSAYYEKGYCQI